MAKIDIEKWLNEPPANEEVFTLDAAGNGKYIPYEIIVAKLYLLCGHNWSTSNLQVTYINLPNRKTLVSGTIEVEVNYELKSGLVKRKLSGGANFIVNGSKVPHTTASVKSLAIMSTVKPLGKQFGWQLNEEDDIKPQDLYEENRQQQINDYIEAIKSCSTLKSLDIYKKRVQEESSTELTEAYTIRLQQLKKQVKSPQKVVMP